MERQGHTVAECQVDGGRQGTREIEHETEAPSPGNESRRGGGQVHPGKNKKTKKNKKKHKKDMTNIKNTTKPKQHITNTQKNINITLFPDPRPVDSRFKVSEFAARF